MSVGHHHNYGADNDNFDENNSMNNAVITNSRYDSNLNTSKKLPPIESILTAKVIFVFFKENL